MTTSHLRTWTRSPGFLEGASLLVLAAARLLTISPDPWQWDEVLFCRAVELGIDLRRHQPHPPGYPLFVEAAQALHALGLDVYRSLAVVGTLGSLLAVAALVWLLRSVGISRKGALYGGVLYALIPSIWLFGVRGFSDGPATAGFFAAAACFVSSMRRQSAWPLFSGIVLVAITFGVRPQTAVPLLPLAGLAALLGARRGGSSRAALGIGVLFAAAISAAVWLPAIAGSGGWDHFMSQFAIQAADNQKSAWIGSGQAAFPTLLVRWLADPFGNRLVFFVTLAASTLGALANRRTAMRLTLLFLPWLFLVVPFSATFAAPRYAAVLLALPCALAALAMDAAVVSWRWPAAIAGTFLLAALAVTATPPVLFVATHVSPSMAAVNALRRPPFDRGTVVHDPDLRMHVETFLAGRPRGEIVTDRPVWASAGDVVVTVDRDWKAAERSFSFDTPLLRRISHGRLLDVRVTRALADVAVGVRQGPSRVVRYDDTLPVSIDRPAQRELVRGGLVVMGWSQERGGGAITPVEARVDGRALGIERIDRFPRPDVAHAIPEIGDASRAGYILVVTPSGLLPGPHDLVVTFRAADGRERVYGPVRFVWGGTGN